MAKEVIEIDPQLSENLRIAKTKLEQAKEEVEAAESAIYVAGGSNIPEKGTVHLTGVKVETGFYEKWDDEKLATAEDEWPQVSNLPFPAKRTYKVDKKSVTYIRDNAKDAYGLISLALTLTPKKPAFTLE